MNNLLLAEDSQVDYLRWLSEWKIQFNFEHYVKDQGMASRDSRQFIH